MKKQMKQLLKENNYPFSSELIDKSNISVKVKNLMENLMNKQLDKNILK